MSVGLIDSAVPSLPGSVTGNIAMEGNGLRVVVADDDLRILMTVASFLLKAGFAVHRAAMISEAVRVRPHLRAMLMTGYPDAEGLGHLPSHVPVLVKPFRRAEFLAKIDCLADEIREAEPV